MLVGYLIIKNDVLDGNESSLYLVISRDKDELAEDEEKESEVIGD